ncbi:adenylyl-sulfate kinase [Campylobacter lari]|nr:adenylyl-sulfate kinase [Campylobacter lari]
MNLENQNISDQAKGCVIWLTGLAGSGKSFLCKKLYSELKKTYDNIIYLDGDEVRELFDHKDYTKNGRIDISLKRSKLAQFLSSQSMIVIVSAISMWDEIYLFNRKHIKNYLEIYVKCDLKELIKRDQKQLYTKALNKEIDNVVGIDINFDIPNNADLVLDNSSFNNTEEKIQLILSHFNNKFKGTP